MPFIPNTFKIEDMKKAILQDFPDMSATSVKLLNNGWDNAVLEVDEKYIFRFPKDGEYRFEEEVRLLEFLRGKITVSIPDPEFIGKSMVYMGYQKIQGGNLTDDIFRSLSEGEKEQLAFDIANFFAEFHNAISIEKFLELHAGAEKTNIRVENLYEVLASIISDKTTLDFISETVDEHARIVENTEERVVLYDDLHTENMAFDPVGKRLRGVFDFGDVTIGDVHREFAREFAALGTSGRWLFERVIVRYEEMTGRKISRRKAVIYMRINRMGDLAEYKDRPEAKIYQDAIEKIEEWVEEKDIYKE